VTYVVDTGVLVDHLNADARATRLLDDILGSGRRVTGSVLSRVELRRAVKPSALESGGGLARRGDWVAVDHEIAALAAEHAIRTPGLSSVDAVIAATADRLDAELLTRASYTG
jgi:predicted nucleic acid-binding protein